MKKNDPQGLAALLAVGQADSVPAIVHDKTGKPQVPAKLSEGEFVFSVPAIVALGEGEYEMGLSILDKIHNELREKAKQYTKSVGLEGAVAE